MRYVILVLLLIVSINVWAQGTTSPYFTGDGRAGMRLAILEPQAQGLANSQEYLPSMVQGVLVSTMSKYSNISVLDRLALDKVIAETLDPAYKDDFDIVRLGQVSQVDYMMTGRIVRTSSGYTLQLSVTDTSRNPRTHASHSSNCTVGQLDDHTAIHRAVRDILGQLGVNLTQRAISELETHANQQAIIAQINLAQGITAQRQGTEVAALSYYFQAAALDPELFEATSRSSVISANISSGNIVADLRNDFAWRAAWVERLKETEEYFYEMLNNAPAPYTLFYSTEITPGARNYSAGTVDISIDANFRSNDEWFTTIMGSAERVAQSIYDGLNATRRATVWELNNWPQQSVTRNSPFNRDWNHNITAELELVNDRNRVIGKAYYSTSRTLSLRLDRNRKFTTTYTKDAISKIEFTNIKIDDVTETMSIRVASVNRVKPEVAKITIIAVNKDTFALNLRTGKWLSAEERLAQEQAERERERQVREAEAERRRQEAERERQEAEARQRAIEMAKRDDSGIFAFTGYTSSWLNEDNDYDMESRRGYHIGVAYRHWSENISMEHGVRFINKGFSYYEIDSSNNFLDFFSKVGIGNPTFNPFIGLSASQFIWGTAKGHGENKTASIDGINLYLSFMLGFDVKLQNNFKLGMEFDLGLRGISESYGSGYNAFLIKIGYVF